MAVAAAVIEVLSFLGGQTGGRSIKDPALFLADAVVAFRPFTGLRIAAAGFGRATGDKLRLRDDSVGECVEVFHGSCVCVCVVVP